jgi:AhpD family alkylhydroperoxidase
VTSTPCPPPPVDGPPRIPPGRLADIGVVNALAAWALGRVAGTGPPRLFTTLGRHRGLFRRWLLFAGGLIPGGRLPRADTELLILRTALNCGCRYEWDHHVHLAGRSGVTAADVQRVLAGPDAAGWTPRRRALLTAADELHAQRCIGERTWSQLRRYLDDRELIELCLLVGHYEMLAMTLTTLGVRSDYAD